ncbi:hypothetical protein ABPG74_000749 [Tetrahymena malaccensis]
MNFIRNEKLIYNHTTKQINKQLSNQLINQLNNQLTNQINKQLQQNNFMIEFYSNATLYLYFTYQSIYLLVYQQIEFYENFKNKKKSDEGEIRTRALSEQSLNLPPQTARPLHLQ